MDAGRPLSPVRRGHVPARRGHGRAAAGGRAPLDRQGRARPVSARARARHGRRVRHRRGARLAPGGRGLRGRVVDLRPGSTSPNRPTGTSAGPVDVACLNAGVLGRPARPRGAHRRRLTAARSLVNVGRRRPRRPPPGNGAMPDGGRIVCTASLAGLTAAPDDPVYAAHEARGGRLRAERGSCARVTPASRSMRSVRASPTRRWSREPRATGSTEAGFPLLPTSTYVAEAALGRASGRVRRATRGSSSLGARRSTSASRPFPGPRTAADERWVGLPPPLSA